MTALDDLDIAVCHRAFEVRGGGEVVAEALAETFDAPCYVGHRYPENEPDDLDIRAIPMARWQRWLIKRENALRTFAHQLGWQHCPELADYDVLVTSGTEARAYVPADDQVVVAYVHAPARRQYDLYQREDFGLLGQGFGQLARMIIEHNVLRPDRFVCNSEIVARRLRKYWSVSEDRIDVVYPPIDTTEFDPRLTETRDFYLYLGRLFDYKHVEEAIAAFEGRDEMLFVAGEGPERERLESEAPENVVFVGYLGEATKRFLLSEAKALVFPARNEDFGMVPLEAMASGTPVIGVREGYTQHQILEGQNGLLYERGVDNLRSAIERFETGGVAWTEAEIAAFVDRHFNRESFEREMRDVVDRALADNEVTTPWSGGEPPGPWATAGSRSHPTVDAETDGG